MTQPPIPVSQKKKDAGRIPGPAAVPNCIEIILFWQITPSRQARVALNGRNLGAFTPSTGSANTLFTAIFGSWNANLALYSPTTVILGALSVRDMTSPANPIFLSNVSGGPGTSVSPLMPEQVALVLTENIATRGRGAKGRLYIPGWATNADAGGGTAIPAVQTAMNAWGTALMANIASSGLTAAVAKPRRQEYIGTTGTLHAERAATVADVTSYTCRDLVWDTQRRRSPLP